MKTISITDFKTGGTAQSLYNTRGFGAVKHGDNKLVNIVKRIPPVQISPDGAVGYDTTDMEIRSFTYLDGYVYGAGTALTGPAYGDLYRYTPVTVGSEWQGFTSGATAVHAGGIAAYQNYIYGYAPTGYLWRCDTAGNFSNTWQTIGSFTTQAKPVVHFGGKTLYFFTDNSVHQLRDATFTADVIEFQTGFVITSACEFGNYLIICGYEAKTNRATAAIWDRDSSLARITNVLDLGDGVPRAVAVLDGIPTVIMTLANKLIVRQFDTNNFVTKATFDSGFSIPSEPFVDDNELYIGIKSYLRSDDQDVTSSSDGSYILKISSNGEVSQVVYNPLNDDQAQVYAVCKFYPDNVPVYLMGYKQFGTYETARQGSTTPIIFETLALREKGPNRVSFHSITVSTTPLGSGGSVTVKARKNNQTAWTTLGVEDTANELTHSITKMRSRNENGEIGDAKLLQFRIEVVNADLTGVEIYFNDVDKESYE